MPEKQNWGTSVSSQGKGTLDQQAQASFARKGADNWGAQQAVLDQSIVVRRENIEEHWKFEIKIA